MQAGGSSYHIYHLQRPVWFVETIWNNLKHMLTTVNILTMLKASKNTYAVHQQSTSNSPAIDQRDQELPSLHRPRDSVEGDITWNSHGIHIDFTICSIQIGRPFERQMSTFIHILDGVEYCWMQAPFTQRIYIYHVIPQHGCKMLRLMWDAEWILQ